MANLYDFTVTDIHGAQKPLKDFEGQVLLVVNVASQCGFTPQYEGLQSLYARLRGRGFAVLGFPCNQFGSQEPGSEAEIETFCQSKFNVDFPLFAKIDVNGGNAAPLYRFLKKEEPGILGTEAIKWNFTKFLIDRNGQVVKRFAPTATPADIGADIERLL
ncbi:glutathione peroxidase [Andreprevotia chitinilytica]|uniref:glutathione peroxidase n=1 Tax=Andreprevotia chitinilytica TaxID=396808 RepID=UPI00054D79A6|nr:glutathione peroxidase [Andreprevotia chitinilytica]